MANPTVWCWSQENSYIFGLMEWRNPVVDPAICAISLGVVGRDLLDRRQGRNQTFNAAGNVVAAISMGLIGYFISNRGIFLFVIALAIPTLMALRSIRADQIDLVAIQLLDGIAAAIFGVVSVLVIADLTKGSGRFNLTLGAVTAAVGTGAALSQMIAGAIVHRFGYHAAFLFLAAVAAAALLILLFAMPETHQRLSY